MLRCTEKRNQYPKSSVLNALSRIATNQQASDTIFSTGFVFVFGRSEMQIEDVHTYNILYSLPHKYLWKWQWNVTHAHIGGIMNNVEFAIHKTNMASR